MPLKILETAIISGIIKTEPNFNILKLNIPSK